jgi:carboxymethylenebutenolidase
MFRLLLSLLLVCSLLSGCAEPSEQAAHDMAEAHQHERPVATGLFQGVKIPVREEMVTYGMVEGSAVAGFMAAPANPDSVLQAQGRPAGSALPALLVIHEWWGLNDNIRNMARQLAAEGYRALAVDLYGGHVATTPDAAQAFMQQALDQLPTTRTNLLSAYAYLTNQEGAPRIAALGWCFGGGMALQAALALPDQLDAAVIYYGDVAAPREQLATLQMPVLSIFGANDQWLTPEKARAFEATLQELGKDVAVHVYDGADHGFANPSGERFNEPAARDAWEKTLAFLKTHL